MDHFPQNVYSLVILCPVLLLLILRDGKNLSLLMVQDKTVEEQLTPQELPSKGIAGWQIQSHKRTLKERSISV